MPMSSTSVSRHDPPDLSCDLQQQPSHTPMSRSPTSQHSVLQIVSKNGEDLEVYVLDGRDIILEEWHSAFCQAAES